ncbi:MAG: helix-turn-helix domain-containing protein [Bacilli bacterium]
MKEIGQTLKETRENIGISIDEVAEDLKLRPSQIEHIEEGNMDAFQDVFYLKYFIRDYAKYLGLKYEDLVDEFNEYIFDYTSKISLDDIKKAKKKIEGKKKHEPKKIASPYTLENRRQIIVSPIVVYAIIIALLAVIAYFIISLIQEDNFIEGTVIVEEESK